MVIISIIYLQLLLVLPPVHMSKSFPAELLAKLDQVAGSFSGTLQALLTSIDPTACLQLCPKKGNLPASEGRAFHSCRADSLKV